MPINSVEVRNFRSIRESGRVELGPITLLIGENNSGKSALLRAVHLVQVGGQAEIDDIRLGQGQTDVLLRISEPYPTAIGGVLQGEALGVHGDIALYAFRDFEAGGVEIRWPTSTQSAARAINIPSQRPNHLAVPFFARRKGTQYETVARSDLAREVATDDRNLTSRIADLATSAHEPGRRYRKLMDRVLGLEVSTYLTEDGQVPGQAVGPGVGISLMRMGEGVSSVVSMLAELAMPGRRLFLIEEPENDLHPKSLCALLEVIREAANDGHQFLVTTHSDIVLRNLGAHDDTRIYRVEGAVDADGLSLSTYRELGASLEREEALLELGYEQTSPYGWLLLEEASGETFVRDVIIPLFVPRLAMLRTVSAGGAGNLPKRLAGLNSMLLFAHLSGETRRAWVVADGDAAGEKAIEMLRDGYSSWPPDRFQTLDAPNIEDYYPARFSADVARIHGEGDGLRAKRLKGDLAREVREWAVANDDAVVELESSAGPLIHTLRRIEASLASI